MADDLEKYLEAIESADYSTLAHWNAIHLVRALRLLAAEVRTLRPLSEVGRLFLALPVHQQVWFDEDGLLQGDYDSDELAEACAKARTGEVKELGTHPG